MIVFFISVPFLRRILALLPPIVPCKQRLAGFCDNVYLPPNRQLCRPTASPVP